MFILFLNIHGLTYKPFDNNRTEYRVDDCAYDHAYRPEYPFMRMYGTNITLTNRSECLDYKIPGVEV